MKENKLLLQTTGAWGRSPYPLTNSCNFLGKNKHFSTIWMTFCTFFEQLKGAKFQDLEDIWKLLSPNGTQTFWTWQLKLRYISRQFEIQNHCSPLAATALHTLGLYSCLQLGSAFQVRDSGWGWETHIKWPVAPKICQSRSIVWYLLHSIWISFFHLQQFQHFKFPPSTTPKLGHFDSLPSDRPSRKTMDFAPVT